MGLQTLKKLFAENFGQTDEKIYYFHSPGRVNLIGEHTDYNGGFVFPCALDIGSYALVRKRNDSKINLMSTNFPLKIAEDINDLQFNKKNDWANYPLGVVFELAKIKNFNGFDILFSGHIPHGAGLSSSASIELLTAVAIDYMYHLSFDRVSLVKICQSAENNFVGVNCGIMDQYAVGMGRKDNAIFLNCKTVTHQYVPLHLPDASIIIVNTNKRRGLADSKYNERRAKCEEATAYLKKRLPIDCLGDLTVSEFETYKHLIKDKEAKLRATHIVYEDERCKKAVDCLVQNDLTQFGKLMAASHESLRDFYEVTGYELDTLYEEALKVEGTIGARMTGAGFGGCTVNIVANSFIDKFIETVSVHYKKKTNLTADFYIAQTGDGTRLLEAEV